ncbi:MAG: VWA domain-containing protein [Mariprofundaceae bacterium]
MNLKQNIRNIAIPSLLICAVISACTTELKNDSVTEHETRVEDQVLQGKTDGKQTRAQSEDAISPLKTNNTLASENSAVERDQLAPRHRLDEKKEHASKMKAYASRPVPASVMQQTMVRWPSEPLDRENYAHFSNNPIKLAVEHPVSTFSIDVDSGSYANIRRILNSGRLPQQDAVRVEEMINYFSYDYQTPNSRKQPFRVTAEMAPSPWNKQNHLLHIGIKGFEMNKSALPASNLVFLIDVSGSMRSANKIGLLKSSLNMLSRQLSSRDRVSIVVYAGASGVVLEPTPGNQHGKISAALNQLQAGGSTNGGAGIRLAYAMAEQAFVKGGINRVVLATDGDFNVGTVNFEALIDLVESKRKSGISLTTLGFGTGNYNDRLMEQLADKGNGNYAYIDTINEARKVLVDEIGSTLMTIAKDVKIQIEFNPSVVKEYRLIGYENRMLKREDFNNDKIDAGEIGAGHTVTALYEVTLHGKGGKIDPLRYSSEKVNVKKRNSREIAFLRLRYKQPDEDKSSLIEYPLHKRMIKSSLAKTTDRFRFSASVAAFGDLLRGGEYSGDFSYSDLLKLAGKARGNDKTGYKGEFINLVKTAQALDTHHVNNTHPIHPGDDGLVIE